MFLQPFWNVKNLCNRLWESRKPGWRGRSHRGSPRVLSNGGNEITICAQLLSPRPRHPQEGVHTGVVRSVARPRVRLSFLCVSHRHITSGRLKSCESRMAGSNEELKWKYTTTKKWFEPQLSRPKSAAPASWTTQRHHRVVAQDDRYFLHYSLSDR